LIFFGRAVLDLRIAGRGLGSVAMLFFFDDYVLDSDRRELRRSSDPIPIEPQVFDILEFLVRNRDRVATRDDLLTAVWNGRIVSESTLSSRIYAARTAIGDDGETQRLIRTLPRKGVRFVAEVREAEAAAPSDSTTVMAQLAPPTLPTIAVLPFDNLSGDADGGHFADGVTEEIIMALARCSGMTVIARNSSFTYRGRAVDVRQVGRELGAGYVLEGSIRRSANTVRITAQLIDALSGAHLWADRFDGDMRDVFEVQDRIAERAVGVIEPRMRFAEAERVRRKPPESLTAYELRLKAMALASELTEPAMMEAIETLERALAADPLDALSMAMAAYYRAQCDFQGWRKQSGSMGEEALQLAWKALAIDDQDGNIQWLSAFAIWTFARDAERARQLFRRSLETNPNNAIAHTLAGWVETANGNPEGGRALIERSLRLNPRHPRGWFMSAGMAVALIAEKRFEEAVTWGERALVENRRSAVALRALAVALHSCGQSDRANQIVKELLQVEPSLTISSLQKRLPFVDATLMRTYSDALRASGLPD
jgi:TolB-like protein/tetratricopeptide (TPR) repeat protein